MTLSSDRRWRRVVMTLVVLSALAIGLAGWNVTLYQHNRAQDLRIAREEARLEAADSLRKAEARAALARKKLDCKNQIAGTILGNKILASIRKGYIDLANVASRQEVKDSLIEDANALPVFPLPKCALPPEKDAP